MPRPVASLASAVASVLQAAATTGQPAWVTDDGWQALTVALWHLRRDALARLAAGTAEAAAEALGVHRDTLHEWRRRGWLSGGAGR